MAWPPAEGAGGGPGGVPAAASGAGEDPRLASLRAAARALAPAEAASLPGSLNPQPVEGRHTAAAVLTSFNKREDVSRNLGALRLQEVPFDRIIVVDNHSTDGTVEMIRRDFPEVDLVEMPHSGFGACETFNIGFRRADTDYVAILDDDVVLPPDWLGTMLSKVLEEPPTTALISSKVVEPGMPDWYRDHPEVNRERYMSTFRGCASLARLDVLEACGFYDEEFFIYGNERDLTSAMLSQGFRVLQYPRAVVQHGTPFGMKAGPRSLYYHVRNLWWNLFKHAPVWSIVAYLAGQLRGMLPRSGREEPADAVGTIGLLTTVRRTPRGAWILVKATGAALLGLPRCLRRRRVCRAPDFSLPVK